MSKPKFEDLHTWRERMMALPPDVRRAEIERVVVKAQELADATLTGIDVVGDVGTEGMRA